MGVVHSLFTVRLSRSTWSFGIHVVIFSLFANAIRMSNTIGSVYHASLGLHENTIYSVCATDRGHNTIHHKTETCNTTKHVSQAISNCDSSQLLLLSYGSY
ncbi:hypothetical protein F4680DRAFT_402385 [Xylaria scruposa]|nr:hypothetical protein F4680DRAFT_402385 [Xylaria scruposa]